MFRPIALLGLAALALGVACSTQAPSGAPATPPAAQATSPAATTPAAKAPDGTPPPPQPTAVATAVAKAPAAPQGTLRVALRSLTQTLNQANFAEPETYVYYSVFDGLTIADPQNVLQPALATSWRQLSPTEWEFKIRQGVRFHNGAELTAEDVKFTYDRAISPTTGNTLAGRLSMVDSNVAVDRETFRIVTKTPSPLIPRLTSIVMILPRQAFEQMGEDAFQLKPIGTGPFKVQDFRPADRVELANEPTSWRKASLAGINLFPIREVAARSAALTANEVDIAEALLTDQVDPLRRSGFRVIANLKGQGSQFLLDVFEGPTSDVRVRQAINHAVNKDSLVQNLTANIFRKQDGQVVGPNGFGYNPNLQAFPYDPALARRLLTDAGFPNGFDTTLTVSAISSTAGPVVGDAIANQLNQVGIRAQVQALDNTVYLQQYLQGGRSPIFLQASTYAPVMDSDLVLQFYLSTRGGPGVRFLNDPTFDQILNQSRQEFDSARREALLQQAHARLRALAVLLYTFQPADVVATQSWMTWEPQENLVVRFDDVVKP